MYGNINSHFDDKWNNNSIIYYKKINNNNLTNLNHSFEINNNISHYNTNNIFDFITTSESTYNVNVDSNDKIQYIYKNNNQSLDFLTYNGR